MTRQKEKATRARSPEKKTIKFREIIDVGKEMIAKYGTRRLSIRALAKKLNMTQTNIYRYVQSKRELWIAIRSSYYNEFLMPFKRIIKEHQGTYIELCIKFAEFFLEFASEDYIRFEIMFLISAPPSNEKGPFEQAYEPFQITKNILNLTKKAIDTKEIKEENAIKIQYQIFGILIGAAKMEADLKDHFNISEPFNIKSQIGSIEEYREFILKNVRGILEGK